MGKLLSGHYGGPPEAQSIGLSLPECHQKLGLKPSDFVSAGPPNFFEKSYGTSGRYLLFLLDATEAEGNPIWRPGYYLLPLEAADVLRILDGRRAAARDGRRVPIELKGDTEAPEDVVACAKQWAETSQPLLFKCGCAFLELHLYPPLTFRRRWRARLRCPERCQPPLATQL